ncbi:MAG: histidine phosphatase family protein [Gemmatimonadota bacterium]|nr:histidine phosphatase family protein [Gemmatimonadota bacterium]
MSRAVPSDATRIVLVRHGETEYNREDRWQGSRSDVPLNQTGRDQASAVAGSLADRYDGAIEAIYASPLRRARETAEILADRLDLEVEEEPALRELDHGRWDGLLKSEIVERYPDEYAAYEADPKTVRRGGGESYDDLAARLWPALERLAGEHVGERIAAVCHGGPIRLVMSRVLDRPLSERDSFGVVNASFFEVELSDGVWSRVE